jgi:ATP-dependent helicase/nuclease subunit B
MAAQRRAFINLFASCRQSIVLISPTTDENGQTLPASSFLDDVASCFSDRAWANCERLHNRITPQVASSFNAIRRNMRLGLLLSATTAHGYQQLSSAVRSDDAVDALRGVAIALHTTRKRRRKCHDGPFDGMLSASVAEAIFRRIGRHFSVRELESYAHCPFQYFLASILRLASSVRDELSDDSRSVGTAAHTSLAKLHTVLPAYAEGDLSDALGQAIEKALADEISEQSEPVSAVERGYRHYVHLRTERLLRHYALQYENYRTDFDEVVHEEFEYRFGPGGGVEVEIHSADTGTIQIAGKIDRIDRVRCDGAEGLRVVDYRAGASATKVDVKRGLSLEAPIGLLAAELIARDRGVGGVMDAGCWSLRESGFAALVQGDVAGDDSWARQRDAILRYLSALLSNVKGGRFPVAPRQSGCERRCDFATVCRIGELRPLAKSWTDAPQLGAAERPAGEP